MSMCHCGIKSIIHSTSNSLFIFFLSTSVYCRSNSKASYLPRQSLEKLNNLDPDHGIYKLTLNSNEDLVVSHTKSSYEIFTHAQHHHQNHHLHASQHHHKHHNQQGLHNGKITPNNLPDVLPLGVKLQSQPSQPQPVSPNSVNGGPTMRYCSSNNLSSSPSTASSSPTSSSTIYPSIYPPPPMQHRYSSPNMIDYNTNNTTATQSYTRSQSIDINSLSQSPQSKFMSQSNVDLKKPPSLETTLEEPSIMLDATQNVLTPAQSESNLSSPVQSISPPAFTPLSPNSARREFHRSVDGGGAKSTDARIFRAELVNATLGSTTLSNHKALARKESLRENIEKITQLQSKLMGAHLSGSFDGVNIVQGLVPCTPTKIMHSPPIKNFVSLERVSPNSQDSNEEETAPVHKQNNTPSASAKSSPSLIKVMDPSTDGLKLMQRSEIILDVSPSTHEIACQTDDLADGILTEHHAKEDSHTYRTTLQPRQRHRTEVDCDKITQELISLLPTEDKLLNILNPQIPKIPSDYVSNLYNPELPMRPSKRDVGTSTLMPIRAHRKSREEEEAKMELEFKEIEITLSNGFTECENDEDDDDGSAQIKKKIEELIYQVNRKIVVLNKEQKCINEETTLNDELGFNLSNKLSQKVRPLEATKFRTYIDDVGHITSLLLSLAERLARAENTLSNMEDDAEKKALGKKRDRLYEQLDEAKRLKKDIDNHGDIMSNMLQYNLGPSDNADFSYFINMKAKLITDARDIAEKIKSSEEQLNALNETLIQSDC